jgi:hypothetical protein
VVDNIESASSSGAGVLRQIRGVCEIEPSALIFNDNADSAVAQLQLDRYLTSLLALVAMLMGIADQLGDHQLDAMHQLFAQWPGIQQLHQNAIRLASDVGT